MSKRVGQPLAIRAFSLALAVVLMFAWSSPGYCADMAAGSPSASASGQAASDHTGHHGHHLGATDHNSGFSLVATPHCAGCGATTAAAVLPLDRRTESDASTAMLVIAIEPRHSTIPSRIQTFPPGANPPEIVQVRSITPLRI